MRNKVASALPRNKKVKRFGRKVHLRSLSARLRRAGSKPLAADGLPTSDYAFILINF